MNEIQEASESFTIKVRTPDGTAWVTIAEENASARHVLINIGKAGTRIQAWADALARMITLSLRSGLDVYAVLQEISGITTANRVSYLSGINIRSGPEGIAYAIMVYLKEKNRGRQQKIADMDLGGFRALE